MEDGRERTQRHQLLHADLQHGKTTEQLKRFTPPRRHTLRGRSAHHRELPVSEPHHPAGPVGRPAPAAHPPGDDPAGPPGEAPQLPEHQHADAKAPAVLSTSGEKDRLQVETVRQKGGVGGGGGSEKQPGTVKPLTAVKNQPPPEHSGVKMSEVMESSQGFNSRPERPAQESPGSVTEKRLQTNQIMKEQKSGSHLEEQGFFIPLFLF